jgi:hypothetical protein
MLYDNFMDVDDYFVVIVNVNQYLLWIPCKLRLECKPSHVNQLKMANKLLNNT